MTNRFPFLFLALLVSVPCAAAENRVLVSDFQGKSTSGILKEFTSQKIVLDVSDAQPLELPTDEISSVVPQTANTPDAKGDFIVVRLFDGTRITASDLVSENKNVVISLVDGKKITVPLDDVEFVRFSVPSDKLFEDESQDFLKILRTQTPNDRLVIFANNSDEDSSLDDHSGVIQNIGPETVPFDLDGDVLPISRKRIYGLIFHHLQRERTVPEAVCRLLEKNGSHWVLSDIQFDAEKNLFRWETVSKIPGATLLSDWRSASFAQKNSVPLLELTPISVQYAPAAVWAERDVQGPLLSLQLFSEAMVEKTPPPQEVPMPHGGTPRARRESRISTKTEQRPLQILQNVQLGGKTYSQAYSLQAKTELTFDLNGEYKTLHGLAGVDDRLRPQGNAKLTIFGDKQVLFETPVRGDSPVCSLNVDLKGVQTMTITVDFPDAISAGTRVNLVNVLLVK